MGDIIRMAEHAKPIPPKVDVGSHAGQRYKVSYDPVSRRWVWIVNYVVTYNFFGEALTAEDAHRRARRKIHSLNIGRIELEEHNASQ